MPALAFATSAAVGSGIDLMSGRRLIAPTGRPLVDKVLHFAEIVVIVAMALVLIAGIIAYALVALQCVIRGYSHVAWSGPNGWKFWEFKILCTK